MSVLGISKGRRMGRGLREQGTEVYRDRKCDLRVNMGFLGKMGIGWFWWVLE